MNQTVNVNMLLCWYSFITNLQPETDCVNNSLPLLARFLSFGCRLHLPLHTYSMQTSIPKTLQSRTGYMKLSLGLTSLLISIFQEIAYTHIICSRQGVNENFHLQFILKGVPRKYLWASAAKGLKKLVWSCMLQHLSRGSCNQSEQY